MHASPAEKAGKPQYSCRLVILAVPRFYLRILRTTSRPAQFESSSVVTDTGPFNGHRPMNLVSTLGETVICFMVMVHTDKWMAWGFYIQDSEEF